MNISELVGDKLPEIKKVLFGTDDTTETVETTEEAVEAAFLDAKLVDGSIVRVEPAVEVGAVVKVIDEAANEIDAPDGDHEMEDGTIIRTEGAVIVEVMAPEAEEEEEEVEAEDEKEKEEMASEEVDVDVKMSAIAADVLAAHNFASAEAIEGINSRFDEMEKAIGMITDIVEKMAAKPSVEPTKRVNNPFAKTTSEADIVEKMRKALKK
jgi:hypothetical protein